MKISTVERLRFKRRTFHVPNLMHKLLEFILKGELCMETIVHRENECRPTSSPMFSSLSESTIKRTSFGSTQIGIKFGT